MTFQEQILNQRVYTSFLPLEEEFSLAANKNYLFKLSFLQGLSVSGERASEFLQGQLSCDLREVSPSSMRQGALCNLKGRIIALLDVLDWQGLQLICPADLMHTVQASLVKTAMLSRVSLTPAPHYQVYGFYLNNLHVPLPFIPTEALLSLNSTSQLASYHLGSNLYILLLTQEKEMELLHEFTQAKLLRGSLLWHCLLLQHKQLQIYPQTTGLFLPHRLNLHLSKHLSFNKGCYKGQEIIARMHYRANLKHGLQLFLFPKEVELFAGQKLLDPRSGSEVGEIIDFCLRPNSKSLAAVAILDNYAPKLSLEGCKTLVDLIPFS